MTLDASSEPNFVGPREGRLASPITIVQTTPDSITLHTIEDHELEALTNISRPVALGVAGAASGGLLGLIPAALTAISHLSTEKVTGDDLISLCICVACFVLSLVAWPYAISGQHKAAATLKSIRNRASESI